MSRLECAFWAVIYSVTSAGAAFLLARAAEGLPPAVRGSTQTILVVATLSLSISVWRRCRPRIVRDLGWGARIALARGRARIGWLTGYITRRIVPITRIGEFDVQLAAGSLETLERWKDRVGQAFEVIRATRPARYARLRRLAPTIYVGIMPRGTAGGFFPGINLIGLDERFVDGWQAETVACALCHELVHAFLDSRGVQYTPLNETRYERLANDEMRQFGRRLGGAGRLSPQVSAELLALIRRSEDRWWWQPDGSRVRGSG